MQFAPFPLVLLGPENVGSEGLPSDQTFGEHRVLVGRKFLTSNPFTLIFRVTIMGFKPKYSPLVGTCASRARHSTGVLHLLKAHFALL